jgi:hypothetical protein
MRRTTRWQTIRFGDGWYVGQAYGKAIRAESGPYKTRDLARRVAREWAGHDDYFCLLGGDTEAQIDGVFLA